MTLRRRPPRIDPAATQFSRGDRVRYVLSRASPPKTQSVAYTVLAALNEGHFASYRIKGGTKPYERVAVEPQLAPLD
jgi:hypothetical protein